MTIGIEHEVGVLDQVRALAKKLGTAHPMDSLNIYTTVPNPYKNGDPLNVAFDKEYYQTQYEVKFAPFDLKEENIACAMDFFNDLYGNNDGIQNKGPDFVGTHIHIFNNYSPSNKGQLSVIQRVFKEMADYWYEKYDDPRISLIFKRAELHRLCTSNNLLKFIDYNIYGGRLYKILNNIGLRYQYSDVGNNKPKYAPVIWSPSRGGKQFSLELRYISNTYFLTESPERVKKLVKDCEDIVSAYEGMEEQPMESITDMLQETFKSFIKLTSLLYGSINNWSLLNIEKLIRESQTLSIPLFSEDRLRFIGEINMSMISDDNLLRQSQELRSNGDRRRPEPVFLEDDQFFDDDGDGDEEQSDDDQS